MSRNWPAAVPREASPPALQLLWNESCAAHSVEGSIRPLIADRHRDNPARVLIVTPQPFYEDRGTPIAVRYVAGALSDLGVQVDLLAFPVGENIQIKRLTLCRCANHLGLKRVPIGLSWQKMLLDVSLWRSFHRLIAARHYDMVHAVEEAAYMASVLCPRRAQPFIYDMASALPEALKRHRLLNAAPLQRVFRAAEQRVMASACHTVCSAGLANYVREREPTASVSQWRFPANSGAVSKDHTAALRAQLQIPRDRKVLLYSGNFASYQGIDLLISALDRARLIMPDLLLLCVGATDKELAARQLAAGATGHEHIRFLPRQPSHLMLAYMAMADVLMLPRIGADNIPLKLYDYMASGRPIVATRQAGHDGILNDQRAFLCATSAESMADEIIRACACPDEAALVGGEAQCYAQRHFGWGGFVEFIRGIYGTAIARGSQIDGSESGRAREELLDAGQGRASGRLGHAAGARTRS